MIRWLLSLLLTAGFGAGATQGTRPAVMASYEQGQHAERMIVLIWADDRGRVRAGFGAGHGGVMFLTRDNVGYVVNEGAEPSVGLQADLLALLATRGQGLVDRAMVERLARQRAEISPVGTERIAGFTGNVYRVTLIEGVSRSPPFEIVISADPRLAPVGRELRRFYDSLRAPVVAIAGTAPQPYVAIREVLLLGTPLRFGTMRLESVENRPLTDALTALPGPVLSREAFSALLAAQGFGGGDSMEAEDGSHNGTYPSEANASADPDEPANDADPE